MERARFFLERTKGIALRVVDRVGWPGTKAFRYLLTAINVSSTGVSWNIHRSVRRLDERRNTGSNDFAREPWLECEIPSMDDAPNISYVSILLSDILWLLRRRRLRFLSSWRVASIDINSDAIVEFLYSNLILVLTKRTFNVSRKFLSFNGN